MSSKISMFKIWWLFWPSNLGGVVNKFSSRGFRKFLSPFFWRKIKVSSRRHLLKQKIPDYNDFSRIYRHLEKILKTRFSLIFESLGKSLRKWCFWESLGKSLLAIGCSQLTSIPCVWCVQITLFTSWKGYGSTSGTKTCILKEKKSLTCQNVTFWNRHDLPHMS